MKKQEDKIIIIKMTLNNEHSLPLVQLEKLHFQLESKDDQISRLHVLLQQATEHRKQLEHQPDKKPGVFSKALMRFGL